MNVKPLKMLDELYKSEDIIQIDLSWSYFANAEIQELPDKLRLYLNLKIIMISGDEPWVADFQETMKNLGCYNISQRLDGVMSGEINMLPPAMSKALGLFAEGKMPHNVLFKATRSAQEADHTNKKS